jgi:Flp pilus assembly protein TadG
VHQWSEWRVGSSRPSARRNERRRWTRAEEGATLVEFAIAVPLLVLFIFGAIDFGWAFGQHINVRSAVREGARLAAVNGGSGADPDTRRNDLIAKTKQRAPELDPAQTAVYIALQDDNGNGVQGELGETVVVCTRYPLRSLSGLSEGFLAGNMRSKAVMRMEKLANFSSGGTSAPAWGGDPCTA